MGEIKFVTVNGVTHHYRRDGVPDGVPLVFINSLGCDLRIWDGVASRLADRFHLIRYDKRGHGLSDTPAEPYSMRQLSGDLLGLLDHLAVERAILIGVSVGGMVALQTAVDHPSRVAALVLCDTAAKIGTEDYWNDRIATLREHGLAHIASAVVNLWLTEPYIEQNLAVFQGFYNLLSRMPLEGYIGTCAALRDADLRDRVKDISAPALVICGAADAALTPETARGLADSLLSGRFQLIEEAAHIPSIQQAETVTSAITDFLKDLDDAG
jgi:3-oxoadipate enol-lactonase